MKRLIPIFLLLTILVSCNKHNFNISNLNGNRIDAMGHAGMGFNSIYPVNSLESILNCFNNGADGTELDVQMTKDNVLVAFHDEDLGKNTNAHGLINSMEWAEIQKVVYNHTPYASYAILSLDDLFSAVPKSKDYIFILDIKLYTENDNILAFYENYIDQIIALFDKFGLEDNVIIESQNEDFLTLLISRQANYTMYFYSNSFTNGIEVVNKLGLTGMLISTKLITKAEIEQAHHSSIFVGLWDVGSKEDNIEAIKKNPDLIVSDKVKHLVDVLDN